MADAGRTAVPFQIFASEVGPERATDSADKAKRLRNSLCEDLLTSGGLEVGGGTIGYEEFLEMVVHKILNRDPKDEILKAFRLFDDDETGKIYFTNLKRVAKELGDRITDEELKLLFSLHVKVLTLYDGGTAVTVARRNFPKQFLQYHRAGRGAAKSPQTQFLVLSVTQLTRAWHPRS